MKKKYLLLFVLSIFMFSYKVNAAVGSIEFPNLDSHGMRTEYSNFNFSFNNVFNTWGQGTLNFTMAWNGYYNQTTMTWDSPKAPYRINYRTSAGISGCQMGNITTYIDNTEQFNIVSVSCPINTTNGGLLNIYIDVMQDGTTGPVSTRTNYWFGMLNFISDDSQNIVTAINNQSFSDITNSISNSTSTLNSSIQQGNSNTNDIKNNTKETNDLIKSDNTSGAETSATNFTNNSAFQDSTGLNAIISLPLNMINNLSSTCSPITLTIPYMDEQVTIPCISTILSSKVPTVYNLLKIVINGFIVYRILLDIFNIVKNAKNPDDDRIEVLEL